MSNIMALKYDYLKYYLVNRATIVKCLLNLEILPDRSSLSDARVSRDNPAIAGINVY